MEKQLLQANKIIVRMLINRAAYRGRWMQRARQIKGEHPDWHDMIGDCVRHARAENHGIVRYLRNYVAP